MSKKKVLVCGFYWHSNLGDNFFIEAYRQLFPELIFNFTDCIDNDSLKNYDAIFFGGGSFLGEKPNCQESMDELIKKPIFYLGVGVEKDIHPLHLELMSHAKLIATRSIGQLGRLKVINPNSMVIPDLVYSLQSNVHLTNDKRERSVLILPNAYVLPQQSEPHWKHAAWEYFKSEFVQFVDWLIECKYRPTFFSMCHDRKMDDDWAAHQIISSMGHRRNDLIWRDSCVESFEEVAAFVSSFNLVITQRYHGIVVSEMCGVPYLSIGHHDKFQPVMNNTGLFLSYYQTNKQEMITAFQQSIHEQSRFNSSATIFQALKENVLSLL